MQVNAQTSRSPQARHNLLVSFFLLDSVIMTTLISFPNKSLWFPNQFSHLRKNESWWKSTRHLLFFLPSGLIPVKATWLHGQKGMFSDLGTITVTDHGSVSPMCLVVIWKRHSHRKSRGVRNAAIFLRNTCPIHDTLSKLWSSAGGKHRYLENGPFL